MIDSALINEVTKLPASERFEFMSAIWQTFDPTDAPVSQAEKQLLDARLQDLEDNPEDQAPWSEVNKRLKDQLP